MHASLPAPHLSRRLAQQVVDETASGLSFRGLVKYQNLGYAVKAIAALQNMPVGNGSSLQLLLGKQ